MLRGQKISRWRVSLLSSLNCIRYLLQSLRPCQRQTIAGEDEAVCQPCSGGNGSLSQAKYCDLTSLRLNHYPLATSSPLPHRKTALRLFPPSKSLLQQDVEAFSQCESSSQWRWRGLVPLLLPPPQRATPYDSSSSQMTGSLPILKHFPNANFMLPVDGSSTRSAHRLFTTPPTIPPPLPPRLVELRN